MKRQLNFDYKNGQYVITEKDTVLFSIDGKELKFVSLDFYNLENILVMFSGRLF